jgi:hypothetical protein
MESRPGNEEGGIDFTAKPVTPPRCRISDGGAERRAFIASLIEISKIHDVDPRVYLTDVLTRIVKRHPNREIDRLPPWACRENP